MNPIDQVLSWLVPTSHAGLKGMTCLYAGHLSELHKVKGRYRCKKPKAEHCGKNKVPCNPGLYGQDSDGRAFCVRSGGYATSACEKTGQTVDEIVKSLDATKWKELEKINSYCESPLAFQKKICGLFYQKRANLLFDNKPEKPLDADCKKPSPSDKNVNDVKSIVDEVDTSTCLKTFFSKQGLKKCLKGVKGGLAESFKLAEMWAGLGEIKRAIKLIDPLEAGWKVSHFHWKLYWSPKFREQLTEKLLTGMVSMIKQTLNKVLGEDGVASLGCEVAKETACNLAGALVAEGATALVPMLYVAKKAGTAAQVGAALAKAASTNPKIEKILKESIEQSLNQVGLEKGNKKRKKIEQVLKSKKLEEILTSAKVGTVIRKKIESKKAAKESEANPEKKNTKEQKSPGKKVIEEALNASQNKVIEKVEKGKAASDAGQQVVEKPKATGNNIEKAAASDKDWYDENALFYKHIDLNSEKAKFLRKKRWRKWNGRWYPPKSKK